MSIFDPQSLYVHHQKKTKKGQVFQKKPQPTTSAITIQDLKKSFTVLSTYGYQYYGPKDYQSKSVVHAEPWSLYAAQTMDQRNILDIGINEVWQMMTPDQKANFHESVFSVPENLISSVSIDIALNSYSIHFSTSDVPASSVLKWYRYSRIVYPDNPSLISLVSLVSDITQYWTAVNRSYYPTMFSELDELHTGYFEIDNRDAPGGPRRFIANNESPVPYILGGLSTSSIEYYNALEYDQTLPNTYWFLETEFRPDPEPYQSAMGWTLLATGVISITVNLH